MNGRVVEVFPRPDIGAGIFFEYLRNDDPISKEFHGNVMDGFPFLLAPLMQVEGVHAPGPLSSATSSSTYSEDMVEHNDGGFVSQITRGLSQFAESVGSHAAAVADTTHRAILGTAGHVHHASRALLDSTRSMSDGLGKELTRRRELFVKRAASLPDVVSALRKDPVHTMKEWFNPQRKPPTPLSSAQQLISEEQQEDEQDPQRRRKNRRLLLSRWLGDVYYAPDEIGPMIIHPTMNMTRKVFLFLVHLYLLMLFIVSFPGSYSTRTKFVVCRKTRRLRRMSSSSMMMESESALCYDEDQEGDDEDEEEDDEDEEVTERRESGSSNSSVPTRLHFSPRFVSRRILQSQNFISVDYSDDCHDALSDDNGIGGLTPHSRTRATSTSQRAATTVSTSLGFGAGPWSPLHKRTDST